MKKVLVVALVVTFGLFVWSSFHLVDAGIEIDNARSEAVRRTEQATLLKSMMQHATANVSRSDLLRLLADDMSGDRIVKNDENRLEIDDIVFVFRDDKVRNVYLLGEEP
jgi:hypothetical protein